MKTIFRTALLLLIIIALSTCVKEYANREFPSVITLSAAPKGIEAIIFSGNLIWRNSGEIREMGFIWQVSEDPIKKPGFKINIGANAKSGDFSSVISSSLKGNTKYILRAYAVTGNITTYGEKVEFIPPYDLPIILNKFEPTSGQANDTLKITGGRFNSTLASNKVIIDTHISRIIEVNDTVLKCIVPSGIRSKLCTIQVITNEVSGTFEKQFISLDYPPFALYKFEPTSGHVRDTIKITGVKFNKTFSLNSVFFGDKSANIIQGNDSVLFCIVPSGILPNPCNITVWANGLMAVSIDKFTSLYYPTPPLSDGLLAYYPFNGDAFDESGNAINGTVHGATLTNDRFDNPNSAYSFNGINNYISLSPPDSFINLNSYSISLWVKPIANYYNWGEIIIGIGSATSPYLQSINYDASLSTLFASSYNIGTNPVQSYAKSCCFGPDQWVHVAITRDNTSINIFTNGILITSQTTNQINNQIANYGTSPFAAILGGRSNLSSSNFFKGVIDEVRLYDRVLSDTEINQLANQK
jgi:Concanavalin A-like lectin/glucanases superfamily/IPT/TIG domain